MTMDGSIFHHEAFYQMYFHMVPFNHNNTRTVTRRLPVLCLYIEWSTFSNCEAVFSKWAGQEKKDKKDQIKSLQFKVMTKCDLSGYLFILSSDPPSSTLSKPIVLKS